MTAQGVTRVHGNKKGIFTRQRQPKMVAHTLDPKPDPHPVAPNDHNLNPDASPIPNQVAHTMRLRYLALANATRRYPLHLAQLARVASLQYTDPQAQMQAAQQAAAAAPAGAVAQAAQVEQQPLDARSVGDGAGAEDEEPTAHEVLQAAAAFDLKLGLTEGADAFPLVDGGAQSTVVRDDGLPPGWSG
jgi:hypothetical protein